MTPADRQRLRALADDAVADHVFVDVRKDELLALLDEIDTWHYVAERDHGAPIETVVSLRAQLAAALAAKDEACGIASGLMYSGGRLRDDARTQQAFARIAELRAIGKGGSATHKDDDHGFR